MGTRYTEVPTVKIRINPLRGLTNVQRFYEKVTPKVTMIIDGKRCEVQRIIGGVWRNDTDSQQHS